MLAIAVALLLAAPAEGKPEASKVDHNSAYWCKPMGCGAEFCAGGKADAKKFHARVAHDEAKGLTVSEKGMVDAGAAVHGELAKLGCAPEGKDPATGAKNCGIVFSKHKEDRFILPGVAAGLAKAATKAKADGYALHITYSFRSILWQLNRMCEHFAHGWQPPCGKDPSDPTKKNTGLSCPGPNVHTDGYAVDIHLMTADATKELTGAGGGFKSCDARKREVHKSKQWTALHQIMGTAGWWWYCGEPWHFEYTRGRMNEQRVAPVGFEDAPEYAEALEKPKAKAKHHKAH